MAVGTCSISAVMAALANQGMKFSDIITKITKKSVPGWPAMTWYEYTLKIGKGTQTVCFDTLRDPHGETRSEGKANDGRIILSWGEFKRDFTAFCYSPVPGLHSLGTGTGIGAADDFSPESLFGCLAVDTAQPPIENSSLDDGSSQLSLTKQFAHAFADVRICEFGSTGTDSRRSATCRIFADDSPADSLSAALNTAGGRIEQLANGLSGGLDTALSQRLDEPLLTELADFVISARKRRMPEPAVLDEVFADRLPDLSMI